MLYRSATKIQQLYRFRKLNRQGFIKKVRK